MRDWYPGDIYIVMCWFACMGILLLWGLATGEAAL